MELYNIINLVYFFKSADFYYLEIIPLVGKTYVPDMAQRPKATVSFCKAGVCRSHHYIHIFSWRQRKKESKNLLPHMFSFLLSKTHFLFSLFPSVFRISKQWKLAAGVGKRESCVLSVGKFLFVQTTWSFPPERNWLRNTVSKRSSDQWAGESMVRIMFTECFAENV